jgi:hypothetical protein
MPLRAEYTSHRRETVAMMESYLWLLAVRGDTKDAGSSLFISLSFLSCLCVLGGGEL